MKRQGKGEWIFFSCGEEGRGAGGVGEWRRRGGNKVTLDNFTEVTSLNHFRPIIFPVAIWLTWVVTIIPTTKWANL